MAYSKAIQNVAKKVTIDGTAKTLAQLLAPTEIDPKANRVFLYSLDDPGSSNVVWYSYDGQVTPALDNGIPVVEGGVIPVTLEQFEDTKFASAGSDFDFWCEQFDLEQERT